MHFTRDISIKLSKTGHLVKDEPGPKKGLARSRHSKRQVNYPPPHLPNRPITLHRSSTGPSIFYPRLRRKPCPLQIPCRTTLPLLVAFMGMEIIEAGEEQGDRHLGCHFDEEGEGGRRSGVGLGLKAGC